MATTRTFQTMLNEYLPNELLKEEFIKRDFLLSKVEKDDTWKGGSLIVPFKASGASSVAYASLSASNDIAEDSFVRGSVSGHKEVWGSMIFNHRDLMEHDMVSEQNFLKILPGAVEDFMDFMKSVVSQNLLTGDYFAAVSSSGFVTDGTNGQVYVDHPERFVLGQKVGLSDNNSNVGDYYVIGIDMNTKVVTFSASRGGGAADISAFTYAQSARFYPPGVIPSGSGQSSYTSTAFSSLRAALLSAANGGSTQLYGQTKTSYPYLQAINVLGSAVTAVNIMEKIFDALTTIRQFGKGNPTDVVMSFKNLGSCMKVIEASKGAFNVTPGSQKASQYGWMEIEVGSVTKGGLKLVGVQEMDDDVIFFVDWRALKFHSNGFFRKRVAPDGKEFYEVRNTTGYQYILDMCLFGELVVIRPSYCGVMYSISY